MYPNPEQYDTVAEDHSLLKAHYGTTTRTSDDLTKSFKVGSKRTRYAALLGMVITLMIIIVFLVTHQWKTPIVVKPVALLSQSTAPSDTLQAVQEVLRNGNAAKSYMDMIMEGEIIHHVLVVEAQTDPTFDAATAKKMYLQFHEDAKAAGAKLVIVLDVIMNNKTGYTTAQIDAAWTEYEELHYKAKQSLIALSHMARIEVTGHLAPMQTPQLTVTEAGRELVTPMAATGKVWLQDWYDKFNSRRLIVEANSDFICMKMFCGSAIVESAVGNTDLNEIVAGLQCMKTKDFASCFYNVSAADPLKNCMVCNKCTVNPSISCSTSKIE